VPLNAAGSSSTDSALRPVSFVNALDSAPRRLVRAQVEDIPLPLPVGPDLNQEPDKGQAVAPPPRPVPGSGDCWGGISRFGEGGPAPALPAPEGMIDGGMDCPEGCCPPCDPCRRGLFGWCKWLNCCDPCCSSNLFWLSGEYLLWRIRSSNPPPLVTTSPPGTAQANAGVLGVPGTSALFGGSELDHDWFSGGRFTVGFQLPFFCNLGFESTYFFLGQRTNTFLASSNGTPILARPLIDATTGREISELVAFPGVVAGSAAVTHSSYLWGVEANLRKPLWCGCLVRVDGLLGFRFLELDEELKVQENLVLLRDTLTAPAGSNIIVTDSFQTRNEFYGGQLGFDAEYRWRRWSLGTQFKLALGSMHQVVNINGSQVFAIPGVGTRAVEGGILALPTNIGHHTRDRFAVIPEVGVKLGYQVTDRLRVFAGYNFLYVSSVVRPSDQVDRAINRSQVPDAAGPRPLVGVAAPRVLFQDTDFWAQGVNFGLEWKY
jgi:hypothetical protein